jgi:hypothetical protein
MKKLTFWLPDAHAAELEVESRRRNISKSELVRERLGLTRVWRCRSASFDAIADLIGSVDSLPATLSARKKQHLRIIGYGKKRPA